MVTLRPYQEAALDSIMAAIPTDKTILIQAATGAGKTIIFCELIRRLLADYPYIRIGILAHRRELITQAQDKLLKVWPEAPIGIACASVSGAVDTEKPVVIGSVQTMARRLDTMAPLDLVIIDEAHRVPPMNMKSQYREWIEAMYRYNPETRVLGVTATPFRLGHGYIYGGACKQGNVNLFSDIHFRISISELQEHGFLCQFRAKALADISSDLSGVRKSGDYNIGDLSNVMCKEIHVGSAVKALEDYGADRRHVVVFCVTIAHAQKLAAAFGTQAVIVHSKMRADERIQALADFDSGRRRVIVNVGVLTEGWDSPAVDCIIMCRPTVSTALFVQMTGRGLRPHPDKQDVLILDLANNCKAHGNPDCPTVEIPNKEKTYNGIPPEKICENCFEVCSASASVCPYCGYEFPKEEVFEKNGPVVLHDYEFKKQKADPAAILVEIGDVDFIRYVSKAGNLMVKLSLTCWAPGSRIPQYVNHYMMFEGDSHPYAREKSQKLWLRIAGTDPPESTREAMDRQEEFLTGLGADSWILIKEDGNFMKVHKWKADPPAEMLATGTDDEVPF